jgi:sodium/potassium/calcium exchanger 6
MSVVWIYLVAKQLLDAISAIGYSWNISSSLLALTVLSWGNSLGDLIGDISVARQGYPAMAVGACMGAPVFNLLFGLGVSMSLSPDIRKYGVIVLDQDPSIAVAFLFLIISLTSTLIIIPLSKFKGYKWYGLYLLVLYAIYLALSILTVTVPSIAKVFQ